MDWHLRRTNWFNEPADVLEDGEATLESCLINEGDHLLLEQGCLPPKVRNSIMRIFKLHFFKHVFFLCDIHGVEL